MIRAIAFELCEGVFARLYKSGDHDIGWERSERHGDILLYDSDGIAEKKALFEYMNHPALNVRPLRLRETVRYSCVVHAETGADISTFKPHFKNDTGHFLSCEAEDNHLTFQFVNYLGKAELCFGVGKELAFEVVPDKISYEQDYIALTEAIAEECAALLLECASPVSLEFRLDDRRAKKSALEQFIFLRQFCYADNMESLFAAIRRNPDCRLESEDEMKPFGTAVPSGRIFANPLSSARGWTETGGTFLPHEVASSRKFESFDTSANRFVKFALAHFREICSLVAESPESEGSVCRDEAMAISGQIESILASPFFADVSDLHVMPANNQALTKREGYAQIFRAFSMADLALWLNWHGKDEVYAGGAKNVALLYEYWLFFELRKIIARIPGMKIAYGSDFINYDDGLTVSLAQGKQSMQAFESDTLKVVLYYNRTFARKSFSGGDFRGSYSRPFRPDFTLVLFPASFEDEDSAVRAGAASYVHFDAKYRLENPPYSCHDENDSGEILAEDEAVLQEEKRGEAAGTYKAGDLMKMHAYNDAIRRTSGSYVLYPGNKNVRDGLYDEVLPGVGAFAIRPGNQDDGEQALSAFLREVIAFNGRLSGRASRISYFENMIVSSPSENRRTLPLPHSASDNLCMVGFMRHEYRDWLLRNRLIPHSPDDNTFVLPDDGIYFYYYAIRDGFVYPQHKVLPKAGLFRASTTDFGRERDMMRFEYLPWTARIAGTELVSAEVLACRLKENCGFVPSKGFNAQYYYAVRLDSIHAENISPESVCEIDSGNAAISAYSPKVVRIAGKLHTAD